MFLLMASAEFVTPVGEQGLNQNDDTITLKCPVGKGARVHIQNYHTYNEWQTKHGIRNNSLKELFILITFPSLQFIGLQAGREGCSGVPNRFVLI